MPLSTTDRYLAGGTLQLPSLPPLSLWHSSIQSMFPLISNGDNFTVVVETSAPETHVYASVIENGTDVARFVAPTISGISTIRTVAAGAQ